MAKNRFCAYELAKPLYLPLQMFEKSKTRHFFWLLGKNPIENDLARAVAGRLAMNLLHALCVFLCIPLFESQWEPLEETSVREQQKRDTFDISLDA